MSDTKLMSTSAIAKERGMAGKELFQKLESAGHINREEKSWVLTAQGTESGGSYQDSKQYGRYIVWPSDIKLGSDSTTVKLANGKMVTAKAIGQHFGTSANKMNHVLSELGWIDKSLKGWVVTDYGKKIGGVQTEDGKSGVPFVRWPELIVNIKALISSAEALTGRSVEKAPEAESGSTVPVLEPKKTEEVGFRDKFPAKHRATDGHMVRSKAEMLVDNWLYMAEIIHAYERKLPIEEDVYCDFYLPTGKVYIEYWGYENDEKYLARKKKKQKIYEKYGFRLIELNDKEVQNLDDILPRLLLKYGIQAY